MAEGNSFGSGELTPDLVRGATFAKVDGRYDAAEVDTFLDRVATAVGVFLSGDAPTALRAEFARNAEIAQQVLDAGQAAAEQLRRQAEDDARAVHARAQAIAEADADQLREQVTADIARSRAQVVDIRDQFIQDLRDLYDRIGASLYRFEKANAEEQTTPIEAPMQQAPAAPASTEPTIADTVVQAPSDEPEFTPPPAAGWGQSDGTEQQVQGTVEYAASTAEHVAQDIEAHRPGGDADLGDSWLAVPADAATRATPAEDLESAQSDQLAPAWTQLPADAWTSDPPAATSASNIELGDPFEAIVEDEPLAPGEPLVDLRNFGAAVEEASFAAPAELPDDVEVTHEPLSHGESLFAEHVELPEVPTAIEPPTFPTVPQATPAAPLASGGWLEGPTNPVNEDERAEALLAGTAGIDPHAAAPPAPNVPGPISGSASPDALAVRQLILDSLAAGQSRDAIERYLEEQLGLVSAGTLIDAALASS